MFYYLYVLIATTFTLLEYIYIGIDYIKPEENQQKQKLMLTCLNSTETDTSLISYKYKIFGVGLTTPMIIMSGK